MTKEQVISLANQFIAENNLPALELIGARLMKAEEFNELHGYERYKHDFWVVEYRKQLPPGVLAETPGNILIIVEEESGRIFQGFRATI